MGVDLDSVLAPGIGPDEVRRGFGSIGLVAPEELIVWYGWHNGVRLTPGDKYVGLPPFVVQANLDWSISNYRYQVSEGIPAGVWAENWFCMESDRGLAAYCSGNATDLPLLRREQVEEYDFLDASIAHQIVSLCTMVSWWIEALSIGAVRPIHDRGRPAWAYQGDLLTSIDHGTYILV